jgi:hypothetical protein
MYCIEHFQCPMAYWARSVFLDVTLERRIRELCAQALTTRDADELRSILSELQEALHQDTELLKLMLSEYPFLLPDLTKPAA